jgi:hypothetical protein
MIAVLMRIAVWRGVMYLQGELVVLVTGRGGRAVTIKSSMFGFNQAVE